MARSRGKRSDRPAAKRQEPAPRTAGTRRRGYQRRSKWQPIGLRVGLAAGLVVAALLIANGMGFFRPSAGVVMPGQGDAHVPVGSAVSYNSIPPTSGPHYASQVAPWASYTERIEDPVVVHNLEHGGIAIAYKGIDEATVDRLEGFLESFPPSRFGNRVKLVIHPDERLNDGEIVLTAWERLDRLEEFDEARIRKFYEAHLDQCCEDVP
ncbi:MAG: DUF3105 domain-containing protein [Candidatus Limnocylindria bacterium]